MRIVNHAPRGRSVDCVVGLILRSRLAFFELSYAAQPMEIGRQPSSNTESLHLKPDKQRV